MDTGDRRVTQLYQGKKRAPNNEVQATLGLKVPRREPATQPAPRQPMQGSSALKRKSDRREHKSTSSRPLSRPLSRPAASIPVREGSPWNFYNEVYEVLDFEVSLKLATARNGDGSVHIREFPVSKGQHIVQRHLQLHHQNIVEVKEVFYFHDRIFVVTEEMKLCLFHLSRCPGFLSDVQLQSIIIQILEALFYLHTMSLAHGRLSMNNILINSRGRIKLSNQEGFKEYSDTVAQQDVLALQQIVMFLTQDEEEDRSSMRQFQAKLSDAKSVLALKESLSLLGFSPVMLLDIADNVLRVCNAAVNLRHYAMVDRYAIAGPYCVGNMFIYLFFCILNLTLVLIDVKLSLEHARYTRATLTTSAANAGYAALANAVIAFLIILNDTKLARKVHRIFGFNVMALCTFHASVKLHQSSMNAYQELHTTILIICLFVFGLLQIVRYFSYEFFITMHGAVGVLSAYSVTCHVSSLSALLKKAILIYFATLSTAYAISFIKVIYKNFCLGKLLPHAFVSEAPGLDGVVQLSVWLPRYFAVKPGQYIKVWVPRAQIFTVQPLTIAKARWDHEKEYMHLTLFVQCRNRFSRQLLKSCSQTGGVRRLLFFSGPFGSYKSLKGVDTIIMIVTGLGFWSVNNYLEHLLRLGTEKTLTSRIILVWKTKCITPQDVEAINRLPVLDRSRMLEYVRIFDESTALTSPVSSGRFTILPNTNRMSGSDSRSRTHLTSTTTATVKRSSNPNFELLVNDPVMFARDCNGGSFFEFDSNDPMSVNGKSRRVTAVLVSAENYVKDSIKEAISKSSKCVDFYELEFTPQKSPDPGKNYTPFDIFISSITTDGSPAAIQSDSNEEANQPFRK